MRFYTVYDRAEVPPGAEGYFRYTKDKAFYAITGEVALALEWKNMEYGTTFGTWYQQERPAGASQEE